MGEYASFNGQEIKIGTCESMYYLRARQRMFVRALAGNVDVRGKDALCVRFRFPWPDEDKVEPGAFQDHDRAITAHGIDVPEGVDHNTVQFRANAGYLLSLPCPEGPSTHGIKIHRNGFGGAVRLTQQKLLADGRIVPVCCCGGCGAAWRLEEPDEIEALANAFFDEGERRRGDAWTDDGTRVGHVFWHTIAQRILEDAKLPAPTLA
jgi:hypothetical protein